MDKSKLTGIALAALLIYALVGDEKPIDVNEKCHRQSIATKGTDGGRVYICPVMTDAGEEIRTVSATHKRRLPGLNRCTLSDGGQPGLFNRYEDLIGVDCEPVAGGVIFGENADDTEDNIVSRQQ